MGIKAVNRHRQFSPLDFHGFRLSNSQRKMGRHTEINASSCYTQQDSKMPAKLCVLQLQSKCIITCITREHCCHLMPPQQGAFLFTQPAMTWVRCVRLLRCSISVCEARSPWLQSGKERIIAVEMYLVLKLGHRPLQPPFTSPSDNMTLPMYRSGQDGEIVDRACI